MFVLTAVCSDEDCAEELSIQVETLEKLDESLSECDCTLVVLSIAELDRAGVL